VARKVVILGFPGVQALDVVGPFDVFTGASVLLNGAYEVSFCVGSRAAGQQRHRAGLRDGAAARSE
jgi:hypothetical protein